MIDAQVIKKDYPKAYQRFSSFILENLPKGVLGDIEENVIDIVLTSRSECLRFLDAHALYVTVGVDTLEGEKWSVYINDGLEGNGKSREEAEIAGIYIAFNHLEYPDV